MGRGRDAADVPISTGFGATQLSEFKIITDEVIVPQVAHAKTKRTKR